MRATLSSLFQAVQDGLGVSVTPLHFYFPVPNIKSLKRKDWRVPRPCGAFDYRLDEQVERLHNEILPFAEESRLRNGTPEIRTSSIPTTVFLSGSMLKWPTPLCAL